MESLNVTPEKWEEEKKKFLETFPPQNRAIIEKMLDGMRRDYLQAQNIEDNADGA